MNLNNPLLKVPVRYGLIAAPIGLLANLSLYWMGKHPALILPFFDFRVVIFAVFNFIILKEIRDYYFEGILYFWQGMIANFVFVIIFASLVSPLLYVFMKFQPDYVSSFITLATAHLSNYPAEDIARIGKEVYQEQLKNIKIITDNFLAWRYFTQCFGISIFISIIISVILRQTTQNSIIMEETTTPTISTKSVGIRFGIIYGVISVAYFLIITIMGQNASQGIWSWLSYLIIAVFVFLAHKYYKDNGNGFMTYGQGMGITFWQALISVAISSPITYIYIKFIDSGFIDMIKDKQIEAMEQRGMSQEQIDQAMKFAGAFTSPEAILGFGLVGGLIVILIVGLIVSIFTQKKNPEAFV